MPRLSAAKREEHQKKAWSLRGQGLYNTEIAKELGVHRHTVRELLKAEGERRREVLPDEDLRAIATYEAVTREAWRRLKSHPDDARAQNVVGYLNAILGAQNGKNRVTGAETPVRSEIDISYRDYTTGTELSDLFAEIDGYLETQDAQGGQVNSEEPLYPSHPDL